MPRASRGTATVEFALTAPILVSLLLGVCDIAPSASVRFKFGNATQSVGDLATQFAQLQASDMADIFAGGAAVLAPFSATGLSMRITNVVSNGLGTASVYWSCANGSFTPTTAKTAVNTLPTGSLVDTILNRFNVPGSPYNRNGTNTSYVSVEASYTYTAPAQFILKSPQTMSFFNYLYPRVSTYIGFPWDGNANHSTTVPNQTTSIRSITLSNGAVCSYAT